MCQYQSLFYDSQIGYIVKCNQCNLYQVGFDTVILNCSREDFYYFFQKIKSHKEQIDISNISLIKSILIATPCIGLFLYLSEKELMDLYFMLDQGDTEMKFQELTQFISYL